MMESELRYGGGVGLWWSWGLVGLGGRGCCWVGSGMLRNFSWAELCSIKGLALMVYEEY